MMNELHKFKETAISHGVCDEYLGKWNKATSKKELIDIALSSEGCEFMCSSINEGWGIDKAFFKRTFYPYLNGRYKYDKKYTSSIYVDYKGSILADTTLMQVIDCDMCISVPSTMITKVFICGDSNVVFKGNGRLIVIVYGDKPKIDYKDFKGNIKFIKGQQWIRN